MLTRLLHCVGGKLAAGNGEAEDEAGVRKGKQKVSRKERIQRKREQRRAERQAGSDDEDLGQGSALHLHYSPSNTVSLEAVLAGLSRCYSANQDHHYTVGPVTSGS